MAAFSSVLTLVHLVGLVLAVGAATVKLRLLLRCRTDQAFLPAYLTTVRPITQQIILGQVMLTLSGVGWLLLGYSFTPLLVVKIVLVGAVWVLGPMIDKVAEPQFRAAAPAAGEAISPAFTSSFRRYLTLEALATGLFYAITLMWVLR